MYVCMYRYLVCNVKGMGMEGRGEGGGGGERESAILVRTIRDYLCVFTKQKLPIIINNLCVSVIFCCFFLP